MDDVASVRSENASLRKIQSRLMQWDNADKPLAPLSQYQNDVIYTLAQILSNAEVSSNVTTF